MLAEPALDGITLAVLFLGPVSGRDEFRHQGNDLGMAGRHDRRGQQAMIVLGPAVGTLAGETVRTAELLRAEILGSIPCDQGSAVQPTEGLSDRGLGQQRFHALETRLQKRGVGLVQPIADIIVRRDSTDPEQRLAVGAAMALLQRALKTEKRRALHEKHRESREAEVGDLNIAAAPFSRVRKSRAYGLQLGQKGGQKLHPNRESDFC